MSILVVVDGETDKCIEDWLHLKNVSCPPVAFDLSSKYVAMYQCVVLLIILKHLLNLVLISDDVHRIIALKPVLDKFLEGE